MILACLAALRYLMRPRAAVACPLCGESGAGPEGRACGVCVGLVLSTDALRVGDPDRELAAMLRARLAVVDDAEVVEFARTGVTLAEGGCGCDCCGADTLVGRAICGMLRFSSASPLASGESPAAVVMTNVEPERAPEVTPGPFSGEENPLLTPAENEEFRQLKRRYDDGTGYVDTKPAPWDWVKGFGDGGPKGQGGAS